MKKVLLIGLPILFLILGGWLYMRYFFVFGEGVKSGYLNYAVYSIEDKKIFKQLEVNSGKYFDLHYKEYHNTVPWRGNTVYIVDSIVNMREK